MSVVIPAYNREDMIARAVASALAQRPQPPAEVVVVDDASRDATAERARAAGARVIRHEVNRGEGGARNTGIAAATQPWIALLDSDDEWLPDHLDRLWQLRHGHVVVADSMLVCTSAGADDRIHGPAADRPVTLESPAALIFPQNFVNPSATMFRADVAERVGGYVQAVGGADLHYLLRLLEHGTGVVSPEVGALYHVHEGQVTADIRAVEASVRAVVDDFAGRPWWRPELAESLRVNHEWDDLRRSLREGNRRSAARSAAWIARRPRRMRALTVTWRWRLGIRRRSGLTSRDGRPTIGVFPPASRSAVPESAQALGALVELPPGRRDAFARLLRRPTRFALAAHAADRLALRLLGIRPLRA